MRLPPFDELVRMFVPPLAGVALSVVGLVDGKPWERWTFGIAAIAYVAFTFWEAQEASYVEPKRIRKRCHALMRRLAEDVFRDDQSLRVTLFVPEGENAVLAPIVRYTADKPDDMAVNSRSKFRTNSTSLILDAWRAPAEIKSVVVPRVPGQTADQARGWFQHQLGLSEKEAKRLGEFTLLQAECIANIAIAVPYDAKRPVGLVSFASKSPKAIDRLAADQLTAMTRYLESLAHMLGPAK